MHPPSSMRENVNCLTLHQIQSKIIIGIFMEYIILFRAYFNKLYIHTQMIVQALPNKSAEETDRFSKMLIIVETGWFS